MRILNVRLGFAANSSSTHSFIFLPGARDQDSPLALNESEDHGLYGPDMSLQDYGWGPWTAASREAKLGWLGHVVKDNLREALGHEMALLVASQLVGVPLMSDGHVDHQSVPALPRDWDGLGLNLAFFQDLRQYLLQENLVILGGNDNVKESHPLTGVGPGRLPFLDADYPHGPSAIVARKDGSVWTLFNHASGAKVRMTFEDSVFRPSLDGWRPQAPELVDLKITDACDASCSYCYQGSTPRGKHGNEHLIANLAYRLGDAHVFEVALGGGEPTVYPKFHDILRAFRYAGVVPNFTTRRLDWLTGPHAKSIIADMGTFGYSADYAPQIEALHVALIKADLARGKWPTIHYVVGCGTEYDFRRVVEICHTLGFDLTLLGYKENGRGAGNRKEADYDWLSIVKDAGFHGIRIDTALALKDLKRIQDAGIPEKTYTVEEGRFSWYIDAVAQKAGPSSYCKPDQMVSIEAADPALESLAAFTRYAAKP